MFCIKCGTRLADEASFCHSCGARAPVAQVRGLVSEPAKESISSVRAKAADQRPSEPAASSSSMGIVAILPWISLLASLAVAGSALMPWAKLDFIISQSMAGTHFQQGKAILALGLVAAGVALIRGIGAKSILTSGLQFGLASGALGCAIYVLNQFHKCGDFQALCTSLIGDGLYFSVVASGALVGISAVEITIDLISDFKRGYRAASLSEQG